MHGIYMGTCVGDISCAKEGLPSPSDMGQKNLYHAVVHSLKANKQTTDADIQIYNVTCIPGGRSELCKLLTWKQINTNTHTQASTHTHTHMFTHAHTNINTHTLSHTYTHTRTHTNTHTQAHTHAHKHKYLNM